MLHPKRADTDGDGLADLEELTRNANGSYTQKTSPTDADTDNDTLSDGEELTGWTVSVNGGLTTYQIASDPKLIDSDYDGAKDAVEKTALTDPKKTDTDGDGKTDNFELTSTTKIDGTQTNAHNPLRAEKVFKLTWSRIRIEAVDEETDAEMIDGKVQFKVNGVVKAECSGPANSNHDSTAEGQDVNISNCAKYLVMREGDSLTIYQSGFYEWDGASANDAYSSSETSALGYSEIVNKNLQLDQVEVNTDNDGKNVLHFSILMDQ